ncbi:dTDP-4-dehydrorhamnose reductase [Paraburkholderia domus]|uniref:dTDP-4-dehydrorhamnose reductase n=1 Tax=Paraburkholderia domus TaxID=2793075 RepID=UPI0019147C83|nr:dTDP-4-dehydrorhamnose reductase [Paraburkholderia domus]MBK5052542.1 dTDP-4-dehydrorhamnose reductase [Burkholderia sp. R-70006]CAE6811873.1 dTDP-4-dehydrorhamnose reductase [Paraburkholderia domus]CAE6889020.1 dTDP-4-dehydrorhamnose reductase [Paraburkholderia domus]
MLAWKNPVILLTGVNGQVGFELARSLQGLGRVVALDRGALDLGDTRQIRHTIRELKPSLIVNPAAYTAVDNAETDEATAFMLNAVAPEVMAEEAKKLGAAIVHYSTDYVFDGTRTGAYVEDDQPNPQNVYGKSKLAGERAIVESGCAHLIFRTSWVYGTRGKNFLLTMLRLSAERDELAVVADQYGAPTWANTVAVLTSHVLAQAIGEAGDDWNAWWQAHSGVYHLTASGQTSWHGFASAIFDLSDISEKPLIKQVGAASYVTPARRPANSVLSSGKLTKAFGVCPPDWRDALRLCLQTP